MLKSSRSSSSAPVILEGDNYDALRREALKLASEWLGEERKTLAGLHVDVSVLEPEPGVAVKVDDIRAIRRDSRLRPFDGEVKVYIVARAHQMNAGAQNAILRLLEEPPESCRFVLLCQNAGMLLPTVRSRCVTRRVAAEEGEDARREAEADARARAFADALDKPWERMAAAYSWDKLSRDELKEVLRGVLRRLRDKCAAEGAKTLYIETIDAVSELLPSLEQNASAGTVCGALAVYSEGLTDG